MSYTVELENKVMRFLRSLPDNDMQRILARLRRLSDNPRPPGCKKLSGMEGYRIRIGDFRALYTIDDKGKVVRVYRVARRDHVYR